MRSLGRSFREEALLGAHDHLLIGTSTTIDDPLTEAILSGPGGSDPIAAPGTSQVVGVNAEDRGWTRAGGSDSSSQAFGTVSREMISSYLYSLLAHHPLAANIIGHYENLTIGQGFRIVFKTDTQRERWKQIARATRWNRKLRRAISHAYLLGEWFTLVVPLENEVTATTKGGKRALSISKTINDEGDKERQLRGLGPEHITRVICQGDSEYDSESASDAENVLAYQRGEDRFIGADDVIHHRWRDIGNMTRGTTILFPVLRYLKLFEKFIENRHWLNHLRARIPLIRKVAGGASRVNGEAARQTKLPPPGTVMTENVGATWEFPALNLEAEDARHDGRSLCEMIAAGVELPVYFILSNPSDTNYAALMAMDSPVIAKFEGLQEDIWIPDIVELVSKLTGEDDSQFKVIASAVMERSRKSIAEAAAPMLERRVVSRKTVRAWLDLDPDEEQLRVEEEDGEDAGLGIGSGNADDGDVIPKKKIPAKRGRPERDVVPGDTGTGGRRPRPSAQ